MGTRSLGITLLIQVRIFYGAMALSLMSMRILPRLRGRLPEPHSINPKAVTFHVIGDDKMSLITVKPFFQTRIGIWFFILIVAISPNCLAADSWIDSNYNNRAIVEVIPDRTQDNMDIAFTTIYHAGKTKQDGSDIKVYDSEGRAVHSKVEYVSEDEALVVFEAVNDFKRYEIYYNNPSARPTKSNWKPDKGLLWLIYKKGGHMGIDPQNTDQLKKVFQDSKPVAARFQRYIFDSYNPFGRSDGCISLYRGYIDIEEDGDYLFVIHSNNGSFLFIDGNLAVERLQDHPTGDPKDARYEDWPGPELRQGSVKLKKGPHLLEFYNGGGLYSVLAWRRPNRGLEVVPFSAFPMPLKARAVRYEAKDGKVEANFTYSKEDFVWPFDRDGQQYTRVAFRDLSTRDLNILPSHTDPKADGSHNHNFWNQYVDKFEVKSKTKIAAYVYIPSNNPPKQITLHFYLHYNDWEHRAYWGENIILQGQDNTAARNRYVGPLPEFNKWVKLEVRVEDIGFGDSLLDGVAFDSFSGKSYWGKVILEDEDGNFLKEWFLDDPPKTAITLYSSNWIFDYDVPFAEDPKIDLNYKADCEWNFGDGITTSEHNPTHIYLNPGAYEVSFKVKSLQGDDIYKKKLDVYIEPYISAFYRSGDINFYYGLVKDYDLQKLDKNNLARFIEFSYDQKDYDKSVEACKAYFTRFKTEDVNDAASKLAFGADILSQKEVRMYLEASQLYLDASNAFNTSGSFINLALKSESKLKLAKMYAVYLEEPEKAKSVYEEVIKEVESSPDKNVLKRFLRESFAGLGDYYIGKLDPLNAQDSYKKAQEYGEIVESKEKEALDLSSYPYMIADFLDNSENETALKTVDEWESKYPLQKMKGETFFSHGKVLYIIGDYKGAAHFFNLSNLANNASPDIPELLYLLGDSYEKMEDKGRAKDCFVKLTSSYAGTPSAEKAKERLK